MEQHNISSVALIGAGRMGHSHMCAARELNLTVTAVCDKNEENRNKVASEFDVDGSNSFADAREMFDRAGSADLVVIATTADSHEELVLAAAEAGAKRILCEKPMATSLKACDAMIEACRISGTHLAVNHQMRFMDQYTLIKALLESGKLGRLCSMNVMSGCFGLSMNGSHYFEAFSYLTGSPIEEVCAWFSDEKLKNPRGPGFFDEAGQVRAKAASGARFYMEIGADQGHGMTVTYMGEHGHVFVDELEGVYIATTRKPEHREQPPTRYGMPWERLEKKFPQADNVGPTRGVLESLIRAEGYPSGGDGRRVVSALVAAYKSVDSGNKSVAVADLDDVYERQFPWA